jgi:MFS family permease
VTISFGLALFGSVYFIPLFVQGVVGTSATNSGVILTPLTLASMGSSVIAGLLVSRFGKYKWVCILGMFISICGALLLVRLNASSTNIDVLIALLVLGLGMGFSMSVYTLIVQNAMPQRIGQASSSLVFFRSIGSTMGLAAMGSLMTSSFQPAFRNFLSPALRTVVNALPPQAQTALGNPQVLLSDQVQQQLCSGFTQPRPGVDPAVGLQMYHALLEAVKQGLAQSLHNIFLFNTVMIAIAFVTVLFLKKVKLRDRKSESGAIAVEVAEQGVEQMAQEGVSTVGVQ